MEMALIILFWIHLKFKLLWLLKNPSKWEIIQLFIKCLKAKKSTIFSLVCWFTTFPLWGEMFWESFRKVVPLLKSEQFLYHFLEKFLDFLPTLDHNLKNLCQMQISKLSIQMEKMLHNWLILMNPFKIFLNPMLLILDLIKKIDQSILQVR